MIEATLQEAWNRDMKLSDGPDGMSKALLPNFTDIEEALISTKTAKRVDQEIRRTEALRLEREADRRAKVQIEAANAKLKADTILRTWRLKHKHAVALMTLLPDKPNLFINVWIGNDEKRVYLNDGEPFARKTLELGCLYVTGNNKQPPGSFSESGYLKGKDEQTRKAVKDLCIVIGKAWNAVTIDCQEASAYEPPEK